MKTVNKIIPKLHQFDQSIKIELLWWIDSIIIKIKNLKNNNNKNYIYIFDKTLILGYMKIRVDIFVWVYSISTAFILVHSVHHSILIYLYENSSSGKNEVC